MLLHEVNHRAKNSIAMAIAMLRLQMRRHDNSEISAALDEAVQRLDHLARIHEILYRQDSNDVQRIDMAAYLSELCLNFARLRGLQNQQIDVVSDADDITLDVDRAISIALIAGEAISNGLKHAFPERQRGAIRVGLHEDGADIVLSVEDNGVGIAADRRAGSMGILLMEGMAKGLGGVLTVEGDRKTRVAVRFPFARS